MTDQPKGNASRDEWAAFAFAHGAPADVVEPLSRDELRDQFGAPEPVVVPSPVLDPARLPTSEEVTAGYSGGVAQHRVVYPTRPTSDEVSSGAYIPDPQSLVYDTTPVVVLSEN